MSKTFFLILFASFTHVAFAQWTWEDPLPQGHPITTIATLSDSSAWAAGPSSTLLRLGANDVWERVEICPETPYFFQTLEALHADNIWLMGTNYSKSRMYHFDGGHWTLQTEVNGSLTSADWLNDTDAWAVGFNGLILHFDGAAWLPAASGATSLLRSVHFADANNGWAVGNNGVILYYDGNNWTQQISPVTGAIWDVKMTSANEGWAVADGKQLLYFNGNSWTVAPVAFQYQPYELYFLDAGNGWAIGEQGRIWKFSNGNWQLQASIATQQLSAISMLDEQTGWIAGNYELVRRTPAGWQNVSSAADAENQHMSIHMLDEQSGWLVGNNGLILRKNGNGWQKLPPVTHRQLTDVFFQTPETGWAVGDTGTILRFSNGQWQVFPSPTSKKIWEVQILDPANAWAVGDDGLILHFNGAQWSAVASPTTEDLFNLHFYNADQGWAVGRAGMVLRYLNGVWSVFQTGLILPNLNYVLQTSESDGWLVGESNTLLRFNGSAWQAVPGAPVLNPAAGYLCVSCPATDHCYFSAFNRNFIWEWKNGAWNKIKQPGFFLNRRIQFLSPQTGFVIGFTDILKVNTAGLVDIAEPPAKTPGYANFLVYPNPVSGSFFIRTTLPETTSLQVRLISASGAVCRTVLREVWEGGEQIRELTVGDYPPGVYFLEFSGRKWFWREKIVLR